MLVTIFVFFFFFFFFVVVFCCCFFLFFFFLELKPETHTYIYIEKCSGAVGMRVVSVLEGGVDSNPTFAKLVHLYFSNIYIYIFFFSPSWYIFISQIYTHIYIYIFFKLSCK